MVARPGVGVAGFILRFPMAPKSAAACGGVQWRHGEETAQVVGDRSARTYWGADIPMRVIRDFARGVAERFEPEKIILFGSHAYGTPHADSDVDILVVMPAYNQRSKAHKIRMVVSAPFPMDLIVRTPDTLRWRLEEGDSFLREITSKGKVLYEKGDGGVGTKGRGRHPRRRSLAGKTPPLHDLVCFLCQQATEKYLKALLEEMSMSVPKTHDLERLAAMLSPHHTSLRSLRRGLKFLTQFSVDIRYPGDWASKRDAAAALRWAERAGNGADDSRHPSAQAAGREVVAGAAGRKNSGRAASLPAWRSLEPEAETDDAERAAERLVESVPRPRVREFCNRPFLQVRRGRRPLNPIEEIERPRLR